MALNLLQISIFSKERYLRFKWIIRNNLDGNIHRLMHALFHIKTVIIQRDRYWPEGFSPRVDIGRGMITVLIWKKACINLFTVNQTYFRGYYVSRFSASRQFRRDLILR
jgi:hypothetical protein